LTFKYFIGKVISQEVSMTSKIQQEIKQIRPFRSSRQEALVALLRTTDQIKRHLAGVFNDHDITMQQYNVLRILRGARPDGLPTMEIRDRMLEISPGITRLVDRLEESRLIERTPLAADRRCVVCQITASGLDLLGSLDDEVERRDEEVFLILKDQEVAIMLGFLDRVRESIAEKRNKNVAGPATAQTSTNSRSQQ
jgi:DNA-binding MarR family transcriptional regulator